MKKIPYGRQTITTADVEAVITVLRSDWLTTGPAVDQFETAMAEYTGSLHTVAVSSGTGALHTAMQTLDLKPGDEVIVPAITFAATANAVVYCGGRPVFADIDPSSLLVDPESVARCITPRTRAIVAVDYAGQPCDYRELRALTDQHGLVLIADACHALGATYEGRAVGQLADINAFSFHPVKHITTGEGGMTTTNNPELARRMQIFRNHGITTDHRERSERGAFAYEMTELGYNYRLSDVQCALGISQLRQLPKWLARRRQIAEAYDDAFATTTSILPLTRIAARTHAYHLYVVQLPPSDGGRIRNQVFSRMREHDIACNVHYLPVYQHPYYRTTLGYADVLCPEAEAAYRRILSLPIFPLMTDEELSHVVNTLHTAVRDFR